MILATGKREFEDLFESHCTFHLLFLSYLQKTPVLHVILPGKLDLIPPQSPVWQFHRSSTPCLKPPFQDFYLTHRELVLIVHFGMFCQGDPSLNRGW